MREKSLWQIQTERNPGHSDWYIQRFKTMQEEGNDIYGEARLIDAIIPRGSKVLDAGSGPGRLGTYLHQAGHEVTGVDIDPKLIAEAQRVCPAATWITADLTDLPEALASNEANGNFDAIVCAGNVMTFLAQSTRLPVLQNFGTVLADEGRAVLGFGGGRGYDFGQFFADVEEAGLVVEQKFSTWDLRRFTDESNFLVAVLGKRR